MSIEELRKEVGGARRRKHRVWFAIVVGLALSTQAILIAQREPRETIRVVHTTTADIVAMPIPLPVEYRINVPTDRTTCPPPRTDARFVAPAKLPEAITQIQPSVTNAGWVAAWNDQHVYISTDGGASWTRRLDAASPVQDVHFDCFGRPIVLRGGDVGIRDGEVEQWRPLRDVKPLDPDQAGNDAAQLLGGGPDIVVIAHGAVPEDEPWNAQLLVSSDLGVTWQRHRITGDWEGGEIRGRQHEDGTVRASVPIPDCMSESAFPFTWKDGELAAIDWVTSPDLAFFGDRMYSSTGWQQIGSDVPHELGDLGTSYPRIIEGPYPIAIADDVAWRLGGKQPVKLPWVVGGDEDGWVADPAGRIWSTLCGQPHVATRRPVPYCPQVNDGEN